VTKCVACSVVQEPHQEMRQRTWTVLRRHPTRTTKYNGLAPKLWHRHRPHIVTGSSKKHHTVALCFIKSSNSTTWSHAETSHSN